MHILFLALYPPFPPNSGGRLRTYNLLKQLSGRHTLTLLCFDDPTLSAADARPLEEVCREVRRVPLPARRSRSIARRARDTFARYPVSLQRYQCADMRDAVAAVLHGQRFDIAHVDFISLAGYAACLGSLPRVLTHHNVEVEVLGRALQLRRCTSPRWWLDWFEYRRWRRFEPEISAQFDALVTVSHRDAGHFRSVCPGKPVYVVPNGVDTGFFRYASAVPSHDACSLLFTGSMDYPPNADAALWFCEAVLPLLRSSRPDITFAIVGRNPPERVRLLAALPGVIVTGTVADVRPYFASAALYVVPLRIGGGTRLKILESMAMGLPVISTQLGCEGLDLLPGQDLVVADTPAQMAIQIARLLADPAERDRLRQRGRQVVEGRCDWCAVAGEQEKVYHDVLAGRSGR